MAEFEMKCPHCQTALQVGDEWIGMETECPSCKQKFVIQERKKVQPEPLHLQPPHAPQQNSPHVQTPHVQPLYGQHAYASPGQAPYGQGQYGQQPGPGQYSPQGQTPYGQVPYGQPSGGGNGGTRPPRGFAQCAGDPAHQNNPGRNNWEITNKEADNIQKLFTLWWISLASSPLFGSLPVVVYFIQIFKFWQLVPTSEAETTPGKAVGFLFIPFYNLYWIHVAFYKLGKHYDAFDGQNSFKTSSIGLGYCVLIWFWAGGQLLALFFSLIFSLLGLAAGMIFVMFLYLLVWLSILASLVFLISFVIRVKGHVVARIPRVE